VTSLPWLNPERLAQSLAVVAASVFIIGCERSNTAAHTLPAPRAVQEPDGARRNVPPARTATAAEGPFRIGPGVTPPRLLKRVEPRYPELAGTHRMGILVLECVVTREGTVRDLKIVRGSSNSFIEAIIKAVEQWRFEPGRRNGQPVDVIYNLRVNHVPDGRVVSRSPSP
jgi:protein TonB